MTIAAYKTIGNVRKAVIGLLLVGASCVSSQASAALVLFNLTGIETASFTLNQSPTVQPGGGLFDINNVDGVFQGVPATFDLEFTDKGQILLFTQSADIYLSGPVNVFSGTIAAPKFILGYYPWVGGAEGENQSGETFSVKGDFNLSITSVPGGVPEPSTWMMMVAGFGLLGGAMRYGNNARAGAKTASLT